MKLSNKRQMKETDDRQTVFFKYSNLFVINLWTGIMCTKNKRYLCAFMHNAHAFIKISLDL